MQLGLNSWTFHTVLRLVVCSVLFSYIKRSKEGDWVQSQLTNLSRINEPSTDSPKNAKSLRPGQSLMSSPRHGYCDVFFLWELFFKVFGSGQSDVRSGTSMTTCCVVNANIVYSYFQKGGRKKCTHNPQRYCGWLSRTHLLISNPLLLAFRILHFSKILSVDKDTTNVLHHLKSILCGDVCYRTNTV